MCSVCCLPASVDNMLLYNNQLFQNKGKCLIFAVNYTQTENGIYTGSKRISVPL